MITIDQLSKSFGRVSVLQSARLEVGEAESVGVVGPSGAGKTTLLRLIAGLENPDAGSISLNGQCVSSPDRVVAPHNRQIGFVFQRPALWPHLSVSQNILFGLSDLPRAEATRRLEALLETLQITELAARRPDELSAGQARRVALARALAPQPKYLLMDEPLTNLDRETKLKVFEAVRDAVRTTAATMVYVTHEEDELRGLATRVVRLVDGQLQEGNGHK